MPKIKSFRVRADLTDFVEDCTKFRWIFIDSQNFATISDVLEHLRGEVGLGNRRKLALFLEEPFCLPAGENINILRDGDLIKVKELKGKRKREESVEKKKKKAKLEEQKNVTKAGSSSSSSSSSSDDNDGSNVKATGENVDKKSTAEKMPAAKSKSSSSSDNDTDQETKVINSSKPSADGATSIEATVKPKRKRKRKRKPKNRNASTGQDLEKTFPTPSVELKSENDPDILPKVEVATEPQSVQVANPKLSKSCEKVTCEDAILKGNSSGMKVNGSSQKNGSPASPDFALLFGLASSNSPVRVNRKNILEKTRDFAVGDDVKFRVLEVQDDGTPGISEKEGRVLDCNQDKVTIEHVIHGVIERSDYFLKDLIRPEKK